MTKKVLFLATEDWFVLSHFLPLLRRARADGFDVVVAARDTGALAKEPVRVIDMPFARGGLRPWTVGAQVAHLRKILGHEAPSVIHAIALKPAVLLVLSRYGGARLFAVTGRGYLAVGRAPWTRLLRWRVRRMLTKALRHPRSLLLVENDSDRCWLGVDRKRSLQMPGAGVDPVNFTPVPEPPGPIVVGVVARLIWSKGVDVVIDAVRTLRNQGLDISVRIAGDVDPENPEHIPNWALTQWREIQGVELLGRVKDVNAFWGGVHIACLASRGGEGLPRSLLEAAACGRPIVTSDAPGCADLVGGGEIGLLAPRGDVDAFAAALRTLAEDGPLRARLGAAGRAKVLAGYTEEHAADVASRAWRRLLDS